MPTVREVVHIGIQPLNRIALDARRCAGRDEEHESGSGKQFNLQFDRCGVAVPREDLLSDLIEARA